MLRFAYAPVVRWARVEVAHCIKEREQLGVQPSRSAPSCDVERRPRAT